MMELEIVLTAVAGVAAGGMAWHAAYLFVHYMERRRLYRGIKEDRAKLDPALVATVGLTVDIHVEHEATVDTSDAYEPGYDYLVIREVTCDGHSFSGNKDTRILIGTSEFDDFDPDDLLISTIVKELNKIPEDI